MKYDNLATMFYAKREEMGSHTGYMYKSAEQWHSVSFKDAVDRAEKISAGLASIGIKSRHSRQHQLDCEFGHSPQRAGQITYCRST